ncbi:MAG: LysE family transporter [Solirubrobacteraceae bacterium]
MHAALVGIALGAGIGAQIGPMSLFLIRYALRNRWAVGLAIGVAIALVDGLYAATGAADVAPLPDVGPLRIILVLVDSAVLLWLGLRTLWSAWRIRARGETGTESATARAAFLTALSRRALGQRTMKIAESVAGLALVGFGGALG